MCSSIVLTYRNVITGAVFVGNTLCNWYLMILKTPTPHDKAAEHKPYNASVLTSWYILFTVYNNLDLLKFFERKSGGALACSRALKQHKYPYVSFVCTFIPLLSFQSFLSLFGLLFSFVSVGVWIIIFARFCRCLDHCFRSFWSLFEFQSITKYCSAGAKLFCIWHFLTAVFFWHPWVVLKGLWFVWSLIR